jgi:hypothetical protein
MMAKTDANENIMARVMGIALSVYGALFSEAEEGESDACNKGPRASERTEKNVANATLFHRRLINKRFKDVVSEVEHVCISCIPAIVVPWSICLQNDSEMPSRRARRVRSMVGISRAESRVDAEVDMGIRVFGVEKAKRRVVDVPVTIFPSLASRFETGKFYVGATYTITRPTKHPSPSTGIVLNPQSAMLLGCGVGCGNIASMAVSCLRSVCWHRIGRAIEQRARIWCGNVSSGLPRAELHRMVGFVVRGRLARGSETRQAGFWIVGSSGRA